MTDLSTCGTQGFPLSSILKSLFCERTANDTIHFKVIKVVGTAVRPINCVTYEDFISLLRQAVDLTAGIVSLRIIETDNPAGAEEIVQAMRCTQAQEWWEIFKNAFYLDVNDQVALHVMNVT